jgi:hypothetical protein
MGRSAKSGEGEAHVARHTDRRACLSLLGPPTFWSVVRMQQGLIFCYKASVADEGLTP